MIYAELPTPNTGTYKTTHKKHISIMTPEELVGNEKLMLTLMFTGMAVVLITWALRK